MKGSNRRVLVFRGPVHHSLLLRPVEDALEKEGWEVIRYTTDTESCFQAGLDEEFGVGRYEWLPDYGNEEAARRLHREHAPRFQALFMQSNALSLMLPQVFDRVTLTACREWIALREMFNKVRPARAMALHEINRWGVMLGYYASKLGIPYFTFQEGLYYAEPFIYTGHTTYSKSLVWGEATKRKLLEAGCGMESVEVIGHPDLARRWEMCSTLEQQALLDQELPPQAKGKRVVLVFVSHVQIASDAAGAITAGLEGSEWFLAVRTHFLSARPNIDSAIALFKHAQTWVSPAEMPVEHHWRLMCRAECAVIVGCSTTIVEWASLGKPCVQVSAEHMLRDFAAEGLSVSCEGLSLLQGVEKAMRVWDAEGYRERTRLFLEDEIHDHTHAQASSLAKRVIGG